MAIQVINFLIAFIVLAFTYTFNHCYLKWKCSPVILQSEGGNSNRSLISFKKLMVGMFFAFLLFGVLLIFQNYFLASARYPKAMFLVCLILTLVIWNFSRKKTIREYFWHRVQQQRVNYPSLWNWRTWRPKVQPLTAVNEMEMQQVDQQLASQ